MVYITAIQENNVCGVKSQISSHNTHNCIKLQLWEPFNKSKIAYKHGKHQAANLLTQKVAEVCGTTKSISADLAGRFTRLRDSTCWLWQVISRFRDMDSAKTLCSILFGSFNLCKFQIHHILAIFAFWQHFLWEKKKITFLVLWFLPLTRLCSFPLIHYSRRGRIQFENSIKVKDYTVSWLF